MALTDLTRISTSGIATGSTIDAPILRKDVQWRGDNIGVTSFFMDADAKEHKYKDNVKLTFGDNRNLHIYYDGSVSRIRDENTGSLLIESDLVKLGAVSNGNPMLVARQGLGVSMMYNGDTKFETKPTGAVVTGVLTATSFSGQTNNTAGQSVFYDLRVSNDLTVEGTTTTLDTNLVGVDRVEVGANSNTIVGVAITQSGSADIVNLYDGATKVVAVTDVGAVGIKTDSPVETLDVRGSAAVKSGIGNTIFRINDTGFQINQAHSSWGNLNYDTNPLIKWNWLTDVGDHLYFATGGNTAETSQMSMLLADGHGFKVGKSGWDGVNNTNLSTEYFRITTDGKVGIGTNVGLTDILTVNDTNPKISMRDVGIERAFLEVEASTDDFIINNKSISNLVFKTQNAERLRIDSSGKIAFNYDTGASTIADVDIRSNNGVHIRGHDGNVNNANIYLGGSRINQRKIAIIHDPTTGWCRGDLHFCLENTADLSDVDVTDSKMVIKADGKVGIAVTVPTTALEVKGDITLYNSNNQGDIFFGEHGDVADSKALIRMDQISGTAGQLQFHTEGGGTLTKRLTIHENGAISAGVDNDSYELTVQGKTGGAPTLWLRDGTTTGNPRILFGDTGAALRSAIYHKNSNDSLNFYTNGAASAGDERLTITSGGYVGINTNNPERYLHIVGNDGPTGATPGNSDSTMLLDNKGSNGAMIEFLNDTNGAGRIMFTDTDASNRGRFEYVHNGDYIRMDAGGLAERVLIYGTGETVFKSNNASHISLDRSADNAYIKFRSNSVSDAATIQCSESSGGAFLTLKTKNVDGNLRTRYDITNNGNTYTGDYAGTNRTYPIIGGAGIGAGGAEAGQVNWHDIQSPLGTVGGWVLLGNDYNGAHPWPAKAYKIAKHENGVNCTRVYQIWHDGDSNYDYGGLWEVRLNEWGSSSGHFESATFRCINGKRDDMKLLCYNDDNGVWIQPNTIWGQIFIRRSGWDGSGRIRGTSYCCVANNGALATGDTAGVSGTIPSGSGKFELYPFDGNGGSHTGGRDMENENNFAG